MNETGAKSAGRTLVVLEFLAQRASLTPAETVAKACGLPRSSAYVLLRTLEAAGFVEYDGPQHGWMIGQRAIDLGAAAMRSSPLRALGTDAVRSLANAWRATARVMMLFGAELVTVATAGSDRVGAPTASTAPYAWAAGRAILANLPAEGLLAVVRCLNAARPTTDPIRPDRLRTSLRSVRERGVAIEHHDDDGSTVVIAAPILSAEGYALAALELSCRPGPNERIEPRVTAVRESARRLSWELRDPEVRSRAVRSELDGHAVTGLSERVLEVWCSDPFAAVPKHSLGLEELANEHPDVRVRQVSGRSLVSAIEGGRPLPDVAFVDDASLPRLVDLGAVEDLTEVTAPLRTAFPSWRWEDATRAGRRYAVPWDIGPAMLFYRRDLFARAGIDPAELEVWSDWTDAARALKRALGIRIWADASRGGGIGGLFHLLLQQIGWGDLGSSERAEIDEGQAVEALRFVSSLWREDLVADLVPETRPWLAAVRQGRIATLPMGVWAMGILKLRVGEDNVGRWGVLRLPAWQRGGARVGLQGGMHLVILRSSPNTEIAWSYVRNVTATVSVAADAYRTVGSFPAYVPALDHAVFRRGDAYFGGQAVGELAIDLTQEIDHPPSRNVPADLIARELRRFSLGEQDERAVVRHVLAAMRHGAERAATSRARTRTSLPA
jgi:DNA-binding IclR family transcriptional regulator/ABC-type glycerol-3-phosphate transport system substrate-binding protein